MSDLIRLIPPSIGHDTAMQAAADATGAQQDKVRNLVGRILLWSRVDELSEDFLNHLAWALHIDGWEYADNLDKKRWLVKHFHDWHRYKGTEYGLALYWRVLLGRELYKATPPHTAYLGASLTATERAGFEAPHPELRIYPFRHSGVKQGLFCGDCLGDPAAAYPVFALMTDALLRIGSKVELYDPLSKESTDLHSMLYESENITRMATDTVEVRMPGEASGIFPGRCLSGYLVDHGAKERLYTMQLKSAYTSEAQRRSPMSITPSLTPMTVYYREAAENGIAKGAFLHNRWPDQYPGKGGRAHLGAAYPAQSDAAQRLYRYLKLFDPERVKRGQRKSNAFLGAFRLGGMPPHTAEVAVDCTGARPRRGMHTGPASYLGAEFPYASEAPARIAQVRAVGKMAKRKSDQVLLSITNHKPVTASPSLLAGTVTAGEYRLEVL